MERSTLNKTVIEVVEAQDKLTFCLLIIGLLFFLFLWSDKSGYFMFILIRNMQLVQYSPLFNISMQSNTITVLNIIRPTLQFDLIGDYFEFNWIFAFNKVKQQLFEETFKPQAIESDIDTYSTLIGLGTVGIVILIIMIMVFMYAVVSLLNYITNSKIQLLVSV